MPSSTLPACSLCETVESVAADHPVGIDTAESGGFFARLLDTGGFMPRWQCGTWEQGLGWLHILSDGAIFLAYSAIPASLLYFILRRKSVPLRGIFWLFAAFILSCGITHLLDASMFYYPAYRLLGLMKVVTAVVSTVTVVALVRVLPTALRLPGLVKEQESELTTRIKTESEAKELSKKLQDRNSELTVRTRRIDKAMELSRAGAAQWDARTGKIEWEAGLREALKHPDGPVPLLDGWADVLDTSSLAKLLWETAEAVRTGRPLSVELPVSIGEGSDRVVRISAAVERGSVQNAPVIVGFVRVMERTRG